MEQAQALRIPYEGQDKAMSQEDVTQFGRILEEADAIQASIDVETKADKAEEWGNTKADVMEGLGFPRPSHSDPTTNEGKALLEMEGYKAFLRGGSSALMNDNIKGMPEFKALQADLDVAGGYLVVPQQFVQQLIQRVDDMVFMRLLATKVTLAQGVSLGVPTLDTDLTDAAWTTELATGAADTVEPFGKRELFPHPLAKRILVSNKLLNAPGVDAEAFVRERMAFRFAVPQENGFLTGNGSGQPLGVFTASAQGISTGRDVNTSFTTTAITADGLIEVKYFLKGAYWPRAQWIFHRDAMKQIRLLKDGEGQYIWSPGLIAGQPDTLLNMPVNMSEFAPNTFTTGLYVGILGDFSNYWIADSLTLQIQRLVELYAETNQVGFIGRLETDGQPVLEEAFVRATLA